MSTADLVRAFRAACGLPVGKEPRAIHRGRVELHVQLLREEVAEYEYGASLFPDDLADVAQELADIVIVAYGAALDHGIDLDPVIAEVMQANMRKRGRLHRPHRGGRPGLHGGVRARRRRVPPVGGPRSRPVRRPVGRARQRMGGLLMTLDQPVSASKPATPLRSDAVLAPVQHLSAHHRSTPEAR